MTILDTIRQALPDAPHPARTLAPLTLAFVGDTVYDLYVRTMLCGTLDAPPQKMHLAASGLVCAAAQAQAAARLLPLLTEDETAVFKRGRNAHCGTVPKNARVADYHAATGLEALVGYLFLSGNDARLNELMELALKGKDPHGTEER